MADTYWPTSVRRALSGLAFKADTGAQLQQIGGMEAESNMQAAGWQPMPEMAVPEAPEKPAPLPAIELPSLESMTSKWKPQQQPSVVPTGAPSSVQAMPTGAAAGGGQATGDLEAWARQEAARLGIDPDVAVRVANTEGGFADPTRQNQQGAPAFGPYQLYIGGPNRPGLGDEALARGIDPRNPAHARQAITFALEHAARNGWGAFQGAAANGIGDRDGIGWRQTMPANEATTAGMRRENIPLAPNTADPNMRQNLNADLTPDQAALEDPDKWSLCGPVAAVAMARSRGGNWSVAEAKRLAQQNGWWNPQQGMGGLAAQAKLLNTMGYAATAGAADWQKIAQDVSGGNPVTLSTRWIPDGHYVVLERYDPQTGRYYVGGAGNTLKATTGRSKWMTVEEINGLGAVEGALYFDNPASPTPSVAVASPNAGGATSPAQPASPSGAAGVPPASSAALPPTLAQAFRSANGRDPSPAEIAELSQAFGLGAMA